MMERRYFFGLASVILFIALSYSAVAWDRSSLYTNFNRNSPVMMEFNSTDIPLTKITVYTTGNYMNVYMNVSEETEISGTPDTNIAFFSISLDSNSYYINQTDINFRISKDYVLQNNLRADSVYLEKYTDTWIPVRTLQNFEDSDYFYYSAQTDGNLLYAISGKQYDNVTLGEYKNTVVAGKTLLVPIVIANGGGSPRNFEISMMPIGDLIAWKVEGGRINNPTTATVDGKSTEKYYMAVITDKDSKPGKHELVIVVKGDRVNVVYGSFILQNPSSLDSSTSITMDKLFDSISGNDNRIKVTIKNSADIADRYFIRLNDVDEWADYEVTPSNIAFLNPDETKIVYVNINPKSGLESKQREFSVEISNDEKVLKSQSFSAMVIPSPLTAKKSNIENQILVFVGLLLLVFLIIYPTVKKRKETRV